MKENPEKQPKQSGETGKRLLQKIQIQKGKKKTPNPKNPTVIVPQINYCNQQGSMGRASPDGHCPTAPAPLSALAVQAEGPSLGIFFHVCLFLELFSIS